MKHCHQEMYVKENSKKEGVTLMTPNVEKGTTKRYANSKGPDQPAQMCRLIRAFAVC